MTGVAGRRALVKLSGVAVSMTNEACTDSGDHLTFQITDTSKRVIDPTASVVVKIDAVTVAATTYTLNRLTGKVTFVATHAGAAVTITSSYLPLTVVAGCKAYSFTLKATNGDDTDFDSANTNSGFTSRLQTLLDVDGTLGRKLRLSDTAVSDAMLAGVPVLLEFYADRSATFELRAWALFSKSGIQALREGVQEGSVDWQGSADADGRAASRP